MGASSIEVAADALGEVIPMLASACRITGSLENRFADCITLRIEGTAVPDADKVTCLVSKMTASSDVTLTMRFYPVDASTEVNPAEEAK